MRQVGLLDLSFHYLNGMRRSLSDLFLDPFTPITAESFLHSLEPIQLNEERLLDSMSMTRVWMGARDEVKRMRVRTLHASFLTKNGA